MQQRAGRLDDLDVWRYLWDLRVEGLGLLGFRVSGCGLRFVAEGPCRFVATLLLGLGGGEPTSAITQSAQKATTPNLGFQAYLTPPKTQILPLEPRNLGFRVSGLGFRVGGLGCNGLGLRVSLISSRNLLDLFNFPKPSEPNPSKTGTKPEGRQSFRKP